ncbi:MAG: hypothetical protein AAF235_09780 [Planctomycetota bacterium]
MLVLAAATLGASAGLVTQVPPGSGGVIPARPAEAETLGDTAPEAENGQPAGQTIDNAIVNPGVHQRNATDGTVSEGADGEPPEPVIGFVLADTAYEPTVTVRWTTRSGERIELSGTRPFRSDTARTPLGENVSAFVAMGGNRLTKGAAHPRGAVMRVGFYKIENAKPFFRDIAPGSSIEVELRGARFVRPVGAYASSVVQHLKYGIEDLESCGLPGDAREQYNVASPVDTLNGRINIGLTARLGVFEHGGPEDLPESTGEVGLTVEPDGSVTMRSAFSYGTLRNMRDPWKSELPGTFLEPIHFHMEFEVLPEGVTPLDPARPVREDFGGPPPIKLDPNANK